MNNLKFRDPEETERLRQDISAERDVALRHQLARLSREQMREKERISDELERMAAAKVKERDEELEILCLAEVGRVLYVARLHAYMLT